MYRKQQTTEILYMCDYRYAGSHNWRQQRERFAGLKKRVGKKSAIRWARWLVLAVRKGKLRAKQASVSCISNTGNISSSLTRKNGFLQKPGYDRFSGPAKFVDYLLSTSYCRHSDLAHIQIIRRYYNVPTLDLWSFRFLYQVKLVGTGRSTGTRYPVPAGLVSSW